THSSELLSESDWVDVIHEGPLAVDLDDGQPLAVAGLELRVAGDVDLDELELQLVMRAREDVTRPVAQVAPGRVVERDGRPRDTARASSSLPRPGSPPGRRRPCACSSAAGCARPRSPRRPCRRFPAAS